MFLQNNSENLVKELVEILQKNTEIQPKFHPYTSKFLPIFHQYFTERLAICVQVLTSE